jgi:hypothetical protein
VRYEFEEVGPFTSPLFQEVRVGLFTSLEGGEAGDQVPIIGDVVGKQRSQPLDIIAPIAVQFARCLCTLGAARRV